jgi:hypothetical protein
MRYPILICLLFIAILGSCKNKLLIKSGITKGEANEKLIDTSGRTVEKRIAYPESFSRIPAPEGSFTAYLRSLPLKPSDEDVLLFDGRSKRVFVHCGVIDMPLRNKDLQQCADSGMRLYAEYLYANKQYNKITFNFTNGQPCAYKNYAEGKRIKFNGNDASWVQTAKQDYSYNTFQDYLDLVYTYAGSFSLSEELKKVPIDSIQPGDLFIHPGFPGHVVIVMDVCINEKTGQKLFLIAQGFTPAQEIEILINLDEGKINPWYTIQQDVIATPQYNFTGDELYRWE